MCLAGTIFMLACSSCSLTAFRPSCFSFRRTTSSSDGCEALRLDDLNVYPALPNIEAPLRGDVGGQLTEVDVAALRAHVVTCLKDIRHYADINFGGGATVKFRQELDLFKAVRIINYEAVRQLNPGDVDPASLSIFPFIREDNVTNLPKELPVYLNAAANTRPTCPAQSLWMDNKTTLPAWYSVVEKLWLGSLRRQ